MTGLHAAGAVGTATGLHDVGTAPKLHGVEVGTAPRLHGGGVGTIPGIHSVGTAQGQEVGTVPGLHGVGTVPGMHAEVGTTPKLHQEPGTVPRLHSQDPVTPNDGQETAAELRELIRKETQKIKEFEARALDAEHISLWLKGQIDALSEQYDEDDELMATRPTQRPPKRPESELDGTRQVMRHGLEGTRPVDHRAALGGFEPGTQPQLHTGQVGGGEPGTLPQLHTGQVGGGEPGTIPQLHTGQVGGEPGTQPQLHTGQVGGSAVQASNAQALRQQIESAKKDIEKRQSEVMGLEEHCLDLQGELAKEKQKAAQLEGSLGETEEELAKHQEIPEENRFLEEEVEAYKKEVEKMQEKLVVAQRRKEALSVDAKELRETTGSPTDGATFNHGEMNRFSVTVVDQLVKVEDELRQRTTELSELTGPFLRDAHGLLAALCVSCSRLDGSAGAPPTYKPSQGDAKHGLDGAIHLMRYCVEAMESCKTTGASGPPSLTNLARQGSMKGKGKGKGRSKHEIVENDDDDSWDLFSIGRRWGLV